MEINLNFIFIYKYYLKRTVKVEFQKYLINKINLES